MVGECQAQASSKCWYRYFVLKTKHNRAISLKLKFITKHESKSTDQLCGANEKEVILIGCLFLPVLFGWYYPFWIRNSVRPIWLFLIAYSPLPIFNVLRVTFNQLLDFSAFNKFHDFVLLN